MHDKADVVLAKTALKVPGENRWTKLRFRLALSPGRLALFEPIDFVVALEGEHRVLLDEIRLYPADAIDRLDPDVIKAAQGLRTPNPTLRGKFHQRVSLGR